MARRVRTSGDSPPPPPLQELENVSLARRARSAILEAILASEFEDRLPPEDELAKMLNVSRTTIRAAVQDLERDGLISRKRAVGTLIRPHVGASTLALQRLVGFHRLLEEQGHKVTVEISWKRVAAGPELANGLPFPEEEEVVVIDKHYFADEVLAIHIEDFVRGSNIRPSAPMEPVEPSLFDFSRRQCIEPVDHAVVQIVPLVSDRKARVTVLAVPSGKPFTRLHETHYGEQGRPLAWSRIDLDPRFVTLEVFRGH